MILNILGFTMKYFNNYLNLKLKIESIFLPNNDPKLKRIKNANGPILIFLPALVFFECVQKISHFSCFTFEIVLTRYLISLTPVTVKQNNTNCKLILKWSNIKFTIYTLDIFCFYFSENSFENFFLTTSR